MYLVVSLLAVSRLQARLVFTDRDRDLLSSSHGSPGYRVIHNTVSTGCSITQYLPREAGWGCSRVATDSVLPPRPLARLPHVDTANRTQLDCRWGQ